ncbi:hypothetical protein [Streptomyces cadmiisoli]|uniref:hypothetical protein n=1 Tax=Streptomyces cadmiisoli TaxID=2184053 RepID=UPI003D7654BF
MKLSLTPNRVVPAHVYGSGIRKDATLAVSAVRKGTPMGAAQQGKFNDPWWRFIPANRGAGVLHILAGILVMVQAVTVLLAGASREWTVFEGFILLVGCALLLQGVDGLRALGSARSRDTTKSN